MKKRKTKSPQGRKRGLPITPARLEDLFVALALNGKGLAGALGVSPAMISYWKSSHLVEPKHLRAWRELLGQVKPKGPRQKGAWERVCSYLTALKVLEDIPGVQRPMEVVYKETWAPLSIDSSAKPLDLSRASDHQLINELKRRGWNVDAILISTVSNKKN